MSNIRIGDEHAVKGSKYKVLMSLDLRLHLCFFSIKFHQNVDSSAPRGDGGGGATWYQPCPYVCVKKVKDMGSFLASSESNE